MYTIDGCAIPIEVKSGHNSRLRSLHAFIDAAPVGVGVRVWSEPLAIDEVQTVVGHKPFRLINLPFYLLGNLEMLVRRYL